MGQSAHLARSISTVAALILSLSVLAACTTSDDESDQTPTAKPPTSTSTSTVVTGAPATPTKQPQKPTLPPTTVATSAGGTVSPSAFEDANSQTISDGLCQAKIPDDWVDDSTGHGVSTSGAKYVLFGGKVNSDDDWNEAVGLVKTAAEKQKDSKVTEDKDFVRVIFAGDRGFEYRGRFDKLYCDFTVTSAQPIPETERAFWDPIIASLGPAPTGN